MFSPSSQFHLLSVANGPIAVESTYVNQRAAIYFHSHIMYVVYAIFLYLSTLCTRGPWLLFWLCVILLLPLIGQSRFKDSSQFYKIVIPYFLFFTPSVTSPFTIKHVLFNHALSSPVAVNSLQGVISTVRGR